MEEFILRELLKPQEDVLSSSSSSSSEESSPRVQRKRRKIENFTEEVVQSFDDRLFKEHFHISRKTVEVLIHRFKESSYSANPKNKSEIPPEKAVLLAIWYLSNRESFQQISVRFNISISSAHRTLFRVIDFLLSVKSEYIKWPSDEEKIIVSSEFKKKKGFDGVIGCIDGSHIKINRPKSDQNSFINRKGYHSILIQGIVDHKMAFIDVYCGEPGSLDDARLLRKSDIFRRAKEDPMIFGEYYLLGDSAYPSLPWLIPPFKEDGFLTEHQKIFNHKLSSTRIVVENAFHLLKNRFKRLDHFQNLDIKFIVKCVMAACVLHNICLTNDIIDFAESVVSTNNETEIFEPESTDSMSVTQDRRSTIFKNMLKYTNL